MIYSKQINEIANICAGEVLRGDRIVNTAYKVCEWSYPSIYLLVSNT